MNAFEKTIQFLAPQAALTRQVARNKLEVLNALQNGGGYGLHGASIVKKSLSRWITGGKDADSDIVENIETLRERSRDLYMGSPLATGAIKTLRTNIIGSGLMLNAQIDAKFLGMTEEEARQWEENTEREWRLWSENTNCDAERKQTFYQLQSLVLMSALVNGDVFVVLPVIRTPGSVYDLKVGLIEADRVCNPQNPAKPNLNIVGGIECGKFGETVAYWICNKNPNSPGRSLETAVNKWTRVPAIGERTGRKNVLHVMCDVERPAQRRGVPLLAPVLESMKQLSRYSDAELTAALVSSMFTVFITTKSPAEQIAYGLGGVNSVPGVNPPKNLPEPDYTLGSGTVVMLEDGEQAQFADPKRPVSGFETFVQAVCRQIGSALEIPYELLVKNFDSSYSASRAALLEAWKMFRMRRDWISSSFCKPVYEAWLTEAVLKGRIDAPGFFDDPLIRAAWCGSEWYGDAQGQLDPLKEVNAAKIRVEEGFSTREREAAELTGTKFENIVAIRKHEEAMMKDAGLTQHTTIETKEVEEDDESENN